MLHLMTMLTGTEMSRRPALHTKCDRTKRTTNRRGDRLICMHSGLPMALQGPLHAEHRPLRLVMAGMLDRGELLERLTNAVGLARVFAKVVDSQCQAACAELQERRESRL